MLGTDTSDPPADVDRARLFALLGRLLGDPPDAALLHRLAMPHRAPGALGTAYVALARAAAVATPDGTQREFATLFAGQGEGQVPLHAAHYSAAAHEGLHAALARLGVERAEGVSEPDDHIAVLCETYAGLLAGVFGTAEAEAAGFFVHHIGPWAARCFADLEAAEAAVFYRAVGRLGRAAIGSVADTTPPG